VAQAGEGYGDLLLVAAADAISDDENVVAGSQQVNRGLCDADVALDADNDAGEGPCCVEGIEGLLDLRGAGGVSMNRVGRMGNKTTKPTSSKTKSCRGGSGSGRHRGRRGAAQGMSRPDVRGSVWLRRRGC
jgi:hypothetical protein